jgi:hypothetical protein
MEISKQNNHLVYNPSVPNLLKAPGHPNILMPYIDLFTVTTDAIDRYAQATHLHAAVAYATGVIILLIQAW